jgi:hypothetical protein
MVVLVIGDMHLKIASLETGKQFLGWIHTLVMKHKPALVVNLGDTFDSHSVLRSELLGEYGKHVVQVCNSQQATQEQTVYVHVLGNHEFYKPNSSEYHALQSLKGLHDDYYVADTDDAVNCWGMSFIPYHPDPATFPKQLGEICFAHQAFIGADFGQYRPEVGVDMDSVSSELIVSGHIHKGQQVGKVIYPGSPFARGVDDVDQTKGIYLLDTSTYKMTFIESPFPRWRSYSAEPPSSGNQLSIDKIHAELLSTLTVGDHWIVTLSGPKAELGAYLDSKAFKDLRMDYNIQVRAKYTDGQKERAQIKAVTPLDAIYQYVDTIYDGDLDRNLLKQRALEMMSKKS